MKQRKIKWISVLAAAALALTCAAPAAAEEAVMPEETAVQEAVDFSEIPAPAEVTEAAVTETQTVMAEEPEMMVSLQSDPAEESGTGAEQPAESEGIPAAEETMPAETAVPAEESGKAEETVQPAETAETAEAEQPEEAAEAETEEELLEAEAEEAGPPSVSYSTHVQTYGWQKPVKDGEMSGTSGESKRLEGIKIDVSGVEGLGVEYRTHVQTYGWESAYQKDGAVSGTEGQSKRLEAIQIRLTGEAAAEYDVYYCVHVQTYGWLDWAKNDEVAGTAGYGKRLEGICIKVQKKDQAAPAPLGTRGVPALYGSVAYETHVQTYGWQGYVRDGALAGTTGQSKRLEGIRMQLENTSLPGFIQYRTHVQTYGWEKGWKASGKTSGTEGESKRLEAIQIRLFGEIAAEYDVWYRTHVQSYGWSGWASNGTSCGSEGCSYRLECIQVKLLPKGSEAPGSTENTLYTKRREEAVTDSVLAKAFAYVDSVTNSAMTDEEKLRACFVSFRDKRERNPWLPHYTGADWPQKYADNFFDTMSGNCISYAAAFAYMAKAIGYENVYGVNSGGHGWAEINGLVYDPEWAIHYGDAYYALPYNASSSVNYAGVVANALPTTRLKI